MSHKGLTPEMLYGFSASILASRYDEPKPIPLFHQEMWEYCCDPHPQVAIAAPRGHAKSTAITFAYVLAEMLFRRSSHALVLSANEELASGFVTEIKTELQENEDLIQYFGVHRFVKENESEIIVQMEDGHKFRIIAKGSQQRMRGLKWERKRPDLVVGDDLEDDEIVLNKERREKFKRWFYGAVLPIIKQGGKVRLVGTIVHMDSLLENLMPDHKSPDTVVDPLRIWSTKKSPSWKAIKYRAHDDTFDNILWPEQFPEERLRKIKQDFLEQGLQDVYGQEFLNDPIDQGTAYFRDEDFEEAEPGSDKFLNYYVGLDFAISKESRADYTVMAVVGVDDKGKWEVVHVRKGRWDSKEIMENMFQVQERFEPQIFFIEKGMIERTIGPFLYDEMMRRGIYMNLEGKHPDQDKVRRARPLQARMRAGAVRFRKDNDWFPDLYEEMRRFPKAPHDDQVDALAWVGLGLLDLNNAPTPEEYAEALWQEEYDSAIEFTGRDQVTGY